MSLLLIVALSDFTVPMMKISANMCSVISGKPGQNCEDKIQILINPNHHSVKLT